MVHTFRYSVIYCEVINREKRDKTRSVKTVCCTSLLHIRIAPNIIQQLSGHKNIQSINNYAKASINQQENMSDILSDNPNFSNNQIMIPTLSSHASIPAFRSNSHVNVMSASSSSTTQNSHNENWQNSQMSSFSGQMLQNATLNNCTITVNQYKCSPVQKRRRICVIDSDSDE